MQTYTVDVKSVFQADIQYEVPLFQRPYVWTADRHWQPLWEDLLALVAGMQRPRNPPHFFGAIVLDKKSAQIGGVQKRQVIDGQQRLTTIQMLLEALADTAESIEHSHAQHIRRFTRNDPVTARVDHEHFKVWPTNADRDHFSKVMECRTVEHLLKTYNVKKEHKVKNQVARCWLYFMHAIQDWLNEEPGATDARLKSLYEAAGWLFRFVVIDLEAEDEPQLIFETLNARGTPLLPADLVKNYLFRSAEAARENAEKLYEKHWKHFEEEAEWWRAETGIGHAKRPRLDWFLQHFLIARTRGDAKVSNLYGAFEDSFRSAGVTAAAYLEQIGLYSKRYKEIELLADKTDDFRPVALFVHALGELNIETVRPLLLELAIRFDIDSPEFSQVVADLESFLVRRMVCDLSTRSYGMFFTGLVSLLQQSAENTAVEIRKKLLAADTETERWPDDQEFKLAWCGLQAYSKLTRPRVKLVLTRIESKLQQEHLGELRAPFDRRVSIEHLMPQGWRSNWKLPESASEAEEIARDRIIHHFGNLTIVSARLNSALSNDAWQRKRRSLEKHTNARLNQQFLADQRWVERWNDADIETRTAEMFELARQIWEHPDSVAK